MSVTRHQAVGAYRRWEPPAFDAPAAPAPPADATPEPAPQQQVAADPQPAPLPPTPEPPEDETPQVQLPTAADIEQMYESAHKEGYATGYEEGTARGRIEALNLHTMVESLDAALTRLDTEVAEEVLALSIEIARQVVRRTLEEHPAAVVEVVREALNQLPQNHALIHLNPDDASLAREYLGEQLAHVGHRIIEDVSISRGGCKVEASGSQIDATLQTRWRRVLENLGQSETRWEIKDE
jgi:flagellar assembly protein FliH